MPKENYAGHILHNVKHDTLEGTPVLKQGKVTDSLEEEHYTPKEESSQPKQEATDHENPQNTKKTDPEFSIDRIKHSDSLMKLYTGCPNYGTFLFILNKSKHFHKGKITNSDLTTAKNYQQSPSKPGCRGKPGPRSELNTENQLLLTLMKIWLDLHIEDLAFRFGVSVASVSHVISTWIEFLGRELEPLIYWPTVEETLSYNPKCFVGNLKKLKVL